MPSVELRAPTVASVIEKFIAHGERVNLWSAEAKRYRRTLFAAFIAACGKLRIDECKAFHLREWIDAQPGLKASATKRGAATAIKAAFRWALDEEYIDRHPFRGVKYAEGEPRPAMPDDVLEELCVCASKRFERVVRFLAWTGCRVSELAGLTWPCVDMVKGIMVIERHKSWRYTRKAKVVPLVAEAVELLKDIRSRQRDNYYGHVFLNNQNRPWNRRTLAQTLSRMKHRGEIKTDCTLHSLRHRMASKAIANGAPLALVSAALGHASPAFTAARYGHVTDQIDAMRSAMAKANQAG